MNSSVMQGGDIGLGDKCFIFDKIINLKFIRKSGASFALRSDYELHNNSGLTFFTRMQIKPDIKVTYSQVANNVAISIKIYITNFHMFAPGASTSDSLSSLNDPITNIKVQMGYLAQFPNFSDASKELKREDYENLTGGAGDASAGDGIKTLNCMVLSAYPTKLPPDSITLFDCVVGNIGTVFHTSQDGKTDMSTVFDKGITLEKYLFESITRRYLREALSKEEISKIITTGRQTVTAEYKAPRSGAPVRGEDVTYLGCMNAQDAKKYGVQIILSDYLKNVELDEAPPALAQYEFVTSALHELRTKHMENLRTFSLPDGNYIMYDVVEKLNNVVSSIDIQSRVNTDDPLIPAVYTITFGAVRTISCPFYTILNPFQKLHFQSRYNVSNLVGYYYAPLAGEGTDTMYSIKLQVTFSTTGDENEMLITSVDGSNA